MLNFDVPRACAKIKVFLTKYKLKFARHKCDGYFLLVTNQLNAYFNALSENKNLSLKL